MIISRKKNENYVQENTIYVTPKQHVNHQNNYAKPVRPVSERSNEHLLFGRSLSLSLPLSLHKFALFNFLINIYNLILLGHYMHIASKVLHNGMISLTLSFFLVLSLSLSLSLSLNIRQNDCK